MTRNDLTRGAVFKYTHPSAKRGLRIVCETPAGKVGLYNVRLSDGALMHSVEGSDSSSLWPVEVVPVIFAVEFED